MLDMKFKTLDDAEAYEFFADIAPDIAPVKFTESRTLVQCASLPFYDEFKFYIVFDNSLYPPDIYYMLHRPRDVSLMDWTNEPIYSVNERAPIKIDRKTCIPYARFFFHFVRGQLGNFNIVEKLEDIVWLPQATDEERVNVNSHLTKISYNGIGNDKLITLTATVIFKKALFKTYIKIAPIEMDVLDPENDVLEHYTIGQMILVNEKLLLEDLNIQVSQPPKKFY
jgi:hypothetical protein